ncbi:MAG: hypothetical protein ACW96U_00675 [Candidatus Heimdallarchaeaceae archaeon]|jgi:hypothetical protein
MTLQQAKKLRIGQIVYDTLKTNADGTPYRWRVNGKIKLWKRYPERIQIPIKRGMYDYGNIIQNKDYSNLQCVELTEKLAIKNNGTVVYFSQEFFEEEL